MHRNDLSYAKVQRIKEELHKLYEYMKEAMETLTELNTTVQNEYDKHKMEIPNHGSNPPETHHPRKRSADTGMRNEVSQQSSYIGTCVYYLCY